MGSEDFSAYLKERPGCYFNIGNGRKGIKHVEMHANNFDFNDKNIVSGTYLWLKLIEDRFNIYLL